MHLFKGCIDIMEINAEARRKLEHISLRSSVDPHLTFAGLHHFVRVDSARAISGGLCARHHFQ